MYVTGPVPVLETGKKCGLCPQGAQGLMGAAEP